jgi:hypothetical protein
LIGLSRLRNEGIITFRSSEEKFQGLREVETGTQCRFLTLWDAGSRAGLTLLATGGAKT